MIDLTVNFHSHEDTGKEPEIKKKLKLENPAKLVRS